MKIFKIRYPEDAVNTYPQARIVASGAVASIVPGVPTKQGSNGAVAVMADGEGTTSERFTGLAKDTSTDTAAAAGVVNVFMPFPGLIYEGFAKTSTAADTQAEIDALVGKRVVFDLTSTDWTVDTAAADGATNGVVIMGGSYQAATIFFAVSVSCAIFE
jgi:hypothetical protein